MPAKKRFLIDSRVLILFLILGIPPLVLGHLVLVSGTEARFGDMVGSYFSARADGLQAQVVGHIEKSSIEASNLTGTPDVQAAVRDANRSRPDES